MTDGKNEPASNGRPLRKKEYIRKKEDLLARAPDRSLALRGVLRLLDRARWKKATEREKRLRDKRKVEFRSTSICFLSYHKVGEERKEKVGILSGSISSADVLTGVEKLFRPAKAKHLIGSKYARMKGGGPKQGKVFGRGAKGRSNRRTRNKSEEKFGNRQKRAAKELAGEQILRFLTGRVGKKEEQGIDDLGLRVKRKRRQLYAIWPQGTPRSG